MLSLGNAFNEEELAEWEERIVRLAGDDVRRAGYTAELKIDGAAVSLTYRERRARRRARRAATAPSARTSRRTCARCATIPLRLRGDDHPAADGDSRRGVHAVHRLREDERGARRRPASRCSPIRATPPRARCASSTRRSSAKRPLRFFGYAVAAPPGDHAAVRRRSGSCSTTLAEWGIPVAPHRQVLQVARRGARVGARRRDATARGARLRHRRRRRQSRLACGCGTSWASSADASRAGRSRASSRRTSPRRGSSTSR